MYKHVLIATDGSELAEKGLEHGLAIAKVCASKATVITVSQPYPLQSPASWESWSIAQNKLADTALNSAKSAAKRHGIEINTRHETNDSAAEAIVDTAKELKCDLIVMASHGRRGVRRLILGSQAAEVVSISNIPVLVVR